MSQKVIDYFQKQANITNISSPEQLLSHINKLHMSLIFSKDTAEYVVISDKEKILENCNVQTQIYFKLVTQYPKQQINSLDDHFDILKEHIDKLTIVQQTSAGGQLSALLCRITGSPDLFQDNISAANNYINSIYDKIGIDDSNLISNLIQGQQKIQSEFMRISCVLPTFFGVKYEVKEQNLTLEVILQKLQQQISDFERTYGIRFFNALQLATKVYAFEEPLHYEFLTSHELQILQLFVKQNFNVETKRPLYFILNYLMKEIGEQFIQGNHPYIYNMLKSLNRDAIGIVNQIQQNFMGKQTIKNIPEIKSIIVGVIQKFESSQPFKMRELLSYLHWKTPLKITINSSVKNVFIHQNTNQDIQSFTKATFDINKTIPVQEHKPNSTREQPLDYLKQLISQLQLALNQFLTEQHIAVPKQPNFIQLMLLFSEFVQTILYHEMVGLHTKVKHTSFQDLINYTKEQSTIYHFHSTNIFSEMFQSFQKFGVKPISFEDIVLDSIQQSQFNITMKQIFGQGFSVTQFFKDIVPQFRKLNALPILQQLLNHSDFMTQNIIQNSYPNLYGLFTQPSEKTLEQLLQKSKECKINICYLLEQFNIKPQYDVVDIHQVLIKKQQLQLLIQSLNNFGFKYTNNDDYIKFWLHIPHIFAQVKLEFYHFFCVEDQIIVHENLFKYFKTMEEVALTDQNLQQYNKMTVNSIVLLLFGPNASQLLIENERDKAKQAIQDFSKLSQNVARSFVEKLLFLDFKQLFVEELSDKIISHKIDFSQSVTPTQIKKFYKVMYFIYIELKKVFGHHISCLADVLNNEQLLAKLQLVKDHAQNITDVQLFKAEPILANKTSKALMENEIQQAQTHEGESPEEKIESDGQLISSSNSVHEQNLDQQENSEKIPPAEAEKEHSANSNQTHEDEQESEGNE